MKKKIAFLFVGLILAARTAHGLNNVTSWVRFIPGASPTITASLNAAGVVRNDVGRYTITWSSAYKGMNYALMCTALDSANNAAVSVLASSQASESAGVSIFKNGALADVDAVSCMAIGNQ